MVVRLHQPVITPGVHASLHGDPVASSTMGLLTCVSHEDNCTTVEISIVVEKRKLDHRQRFYAGNQGTKQIGLPHTEHAQRDTTALL